MSPDDKGDVKVYTPIARDPGRLRGLTEDGVALDDVQDVYCEEVTDTPQEVVDRAGRLRGISEHGVTLEASGWYVPNEDDNTVALNPCVMQKLQEQAATRPEKVLRESIAGHERREASRWDSKGKSPLTATQKKKRNKSKAAKKARRKNR